MTTQVTVNANHGWPVKVIRIDDKTGNWIGDPEIVAPHTVKDFYVWDGQDLLIAENTEAGRVDAPIPGAAP
jgi:hypothetical protein